MKQYSEIILATLKQRNISKHALYGLCGCHDEKDQRIVRKCIELLKNEYPIGSSSSNKDGGYYLVKDKTHLDKACHELHSRAMSLLESEAKLKKSYANYHGKVKPQLVPNWKQLDAMYRPEFLKQTQEY